MRIHEACRASGLTKKAIDYYEGQRLIRPQVLENGYRDYTQEDVERLNRIAVLRKLGLSTHEIRTALEGEVVEALTDLLSRQELEAEALLNRRALAQQLAQGQDWENARRQLEAIERRQTILERLLDAFPGPYGRYLSLHFGCYLDEPIVTEDQQQAFETIVGYLDHLNFEPPPALRQLIDEAVRPMDGAFVKQITAQMNVAAEDMAGYIAEHREELTAYLAYRATEAYRASPAHELRLFLEAFQRESGYNDRFLPAMKRLSSRYRAYQEAMERANRVFLEHFPDQRPV